MELQLDKKSFLDEFTSVKSIENHKAKDRTKGFTYLHEKTTKTLAEGRDFSIGNIDFSLFTYEDLVEYMDYYRTSIEPKIKLANEMFRAVKDAGSLFSPTKKYY